jgi:hypothetical protein
MLVRLLNRKGIAVSDAKSGSFLIEQDTVLNVTVFSFLIPVKSKVYFLELVSESTLDQHTLFGEEIILLANVFLREEYMLPDLSNVYTNLSQNNVLFPIRSIRFKL